MGTVANLVVRVSASTSDFDKQIKSLERSLGSTGAKLQSVGAGMTAAITLPLVGAAIAATKFAAEYEKSTTKLVTLSGLSEKSMIQMRQAVLEMSSVVGVGPRALSEALLVVTSTGFQGAAALEVLELSAKASAVGMGDTTNIARALTAAVNAYGAENLTSAAAADILHATVVAGGADATELAGELGRVVGIASQLGVSFQEVGAFIATYTRLGLSAAEATTSLSGALNTVLSPSAEARKALAEIGMSADSLRAMVSEKGLGAALTTLVGKLHGNADATAAVFGNVRALAGVMGTAGVQATQYAKVLDEIKGSTGGLNKAFEETKKTFAFQWDQFKAQAERAAITLGVQLLPAMTSILQAAKPLGEMVVAMIGWFAKLPQPIQTGVLGLLALAAAIGPVTYAIGTMMTVGSSVIGVFRGISLAAIASTAPLIAYGAAFAGIAFGLMKVAGAWQNAKSAFQVGGIKAVIGELGRNVNDDSKSFFKDWRTDQAPNSGPRGGDINLPYEGPSLTAVKPTPLAPRQSSSGYRVPSAPAWYENLSSIPLLQGLTTAKDRGLATIGAGGFGSSGPLLDQIPQIGRSPLSAPLIASLQSAFASIDFASLDARAAIERSKAGSSQSSQSFLQSTFGSMKDFGANLGNAFVDAVTRASSLKDLFKGLGVNVGNTLGSALGNSLGKMASGLGGMLGGALSSILPGIGGALGSIIGAIGNKLFGPTAYETRTKQDAADRKEIVASADMGSMQKQADMTGRGDLLTQFLAVQNSAAPEYLRQLMGDLNAQSEKLNAAMDRYGISWEQLGTKAQQSQINEMAAQFVSDFDVLTQAGAGADLVIEKMGASINAFVLSALRTGTEIPIAMQPMLQKMVDMGTLVDANGVALTDLSSLTFAETLTQGFTKIEEAINRVAAALGFQFPAAANAAADGMNAAFDRVHLPTFAEKYNPFGDHSGDIAGDVTVPQMASGGYVPPRSGGTGVILGEGGYGEYVIPENRMGSLGGGGQTQNVTLEIDGQRLARILVPLVAREVQRVVG